MSETRTCPACKKQGNLVFHGPVQIQKILGKCNADHDTIRAARCMVQEARARRDDPEGGAWGIVEELRTNVQKLEEEAIGGAENLVMLQEARIHRVALLQKTLDEVDFAKNDLFLLRPFRSGGSRVMVPVLNGTVYRQQANGIREEQQDLSIATNERGFVVLRGWRTYFEYYGLVAGDSILLEKRLGANEEYLVISHQRAEGA